MKKILIIACFLTAFQIQAQLQEDIANSYQAAENTKSGNYKDILGSVFQLAAKNVVGENKSIDFNTTLFALKREADETMTDLEYANNKFSRNLQLNFKANFDDDYKYKGFTGGFTYALVNCRDEKLAKLGEKALPLYDPFIEAVIAYQNKKAIIITQKFDNSAVAMRLEELKAAVDAVINDEELPAAYIDSVNSGTYMNELKELQFEIPAPTSSNLKETRQVKIADAAKTLNNAVAEFYKDLKSKPLLTLSVTGTSNQDGKFEQAATEAIYLQGIKKSDLELDLRARFGYADTLATNQPRTAFKATAGINAIIAKRKTATNNTESARAEPKSFFEIKCYAEYNILFRNRLPDEKRENFLANADFRIRITDDLWLPLTIKYDVENSNFLGFLNLTYNFDSF